MQIIRARVSKAMKRDIVKLSQIRGESEAVLIREALKIYIEKHAPSIAKRHANKLVMLPAVENLN
jgi:hypothetical protein